MTREERNNLQALKIGFEYTEWEDFLLVLDEVRQRDKELVRLYRNKYLALKKQVKNNRFGFE